MTALTDFTWRLFILFIPGFTSFIIYKHTSGSPYDKMFKFLICSALWGVIDYFVVELFFTWIFCKSFFDIGSYSPAWQFFQYKYNEIPFSQTLITTGVGSLLALAAGITSGVLNHWPYYIKHFGKYSHSMDLWRYTLVSENKADRIVIIVDYQNNCKYEGILDSFSGSGVKREIVLRDATIYNMSPIFKKANPFANNEQCDGRQSNDEKNSNKFGSKIYLSLADDKFYILFPSYEDKRTIE